MTPSPHRAPAATGPAVEVLEVPADPSSIIGQLATSEIRQQFEMARAYPRSITQFQNYVQQMALLDEETAASCFYALPRRDNDEGADRNIEGPSARFAEIVCSAWGHMRVEGRVVDELDRFVVARGTSWDVQQNIIIAYEVRRRIWTSPRRGREARRFSDDMIAVTANAAASIALRNSVLKVVPAPLWRPIWLKCKQTAVGDLTTLSKRRKEMLDYFQKAGVPAPRVFATLGVQSESDITLEMLAILRGVATALKEGDTTLDEAFPELRPGQGPVVMPQRSGRVRILGAGPDDHKRAADHGSGPGVRVRPCRPQRPAVAARRAHPEGAETDRRRVLLARAAL
jgi:hypothetical protein